MRLRADVPRRPGQVLRAVLRIYDREGPGSSVEADGKVCSAV